MWYLQPKHDEIPDDLWYYLPRPFRDSDDDDDESDEFYYKNEKRRSASSASYGPRARSSTS